MREPERSPATDDSRAKSTLDRPTDKPPHTRRWPASLTVVAAVALQLGTPGEVIGVYKWLLPACEAALLLPLVWASPHHLRRDSPALRQIALVSVASLVIVNAFYLARLIDYVTSDPPSDAGVLIHAAVVIWITNVAAFAVWYWEIDRGGPFARAPEHQRRAVQADLFFPQMAVRLADWDRWLPSFADYLFVAFTTATTFGPTDTLPLSARAKMLVATESGISLLTLAVVAARAVSLL